MTMHPVSIDDNLIQAIYTKHAGEPQPESVDGEYIPHDPPPETDPTAWNDEAAFVVMLVSAKVCPAWEIPDERLEGIASAGARLLRKYFPGGGPNVESWGEWSQFLFEVGRGAVHGVDAGTMTLKPTHYEPEPVNDEQKQQPVNTSSKGKATTLGEESEEE